MLIVCFRQDSVPAALIVTGPNIASQSLLFSQLATRVRGERLGPVITLQSGDASNLRAALKKIIRDATTQKDVQLEADLLKPGLLTVRLMFHLKYFHLLTSYRTKSYSIMTCKTYKTTSFPMAARELS